MAQNPQPPVAKLIPHAITQHGETRIDNYDWMREKTSPDLIAYLEAENAYLEAALAHTRPLQEQLYQEMRARIQEDDSSVPERRGEFLYYTRYVPGREYPLYCRRRGPEAAEEVLLDQNELAEGREFCKIGVYAPSPDQRLLAYSVDFAGDEEYTLCVKDLASGQLLAGQVPRTYYGVAWASDNRTIFYTVLDAAKRPYKLFRHTVGDDAAGDVLVYHEPDEAYFAEVKRTRSGAYVLLELRSNSTAEVRYLPADQPESELRVIRPRQSGVEYTVEHQGQRFLIVTNEDAQNFRLMELPVDGDPEGWRELLPNRADVFLTGVDAFRDHLVLYEREDALRRIRVWPNGGERYDIAFPEPVYTVSPTANPEYATATLRIAYSSLVTPASVVDYGMDDRSWQVRKQEAIPSGYDASRYVCERLTARAADGAEVPISLVYRRGLARDGANPTLLYGYGSYGITIEPSFASKRVSLLDRGFIYAIAHIRGGAERGRAWYEDGKLLRKRNTFTDFIAAAEHLVAQGYTAPAKLSLQGRSAGGLLAGAVVNMRPDLFAAAIADVPFVDVVTTMSDASLPLTVTEYDEWGNPGDPEFYAYMRSYSPYDNVEAKAYPHILLTSGLNDPRVLYVEPSKMAAKLRALKTSDTLVLLKTNMSFGHFGSSGRFDHLREDALQYAFLIDALGAPYEPLGDA
ncbi:S9 family peptidase [Chloroflexia bacterium SDU3-3]|nr:S9 family peptidase [Chloroflexia bacterium SDU3-3]